MHLITRLALVAVAALALTAPAASAATRHYEGTVVSVDRAARSFRLSDSQRGTVNVKVTGATRFERVSFSSLRSGARRIEVTVRRSGGAWVAVSVQRSGGGGHHGGDD
jgi:hypothetical protein